MNQRHKHADVIIAWANGEEIEYRFIVGGEPQEWQVFHVDCLAHVVFKPISPNFEATDCEFRIKPKRVKKEGWVNVYKATLPNHIGMACTSNIYASKAEALAEKRYDIEPTDTILVSWEEEA